MSLTAAEMSLAQIARTLDAAAAEAGEIALRWFRPGQKTSARTDYKHGGSPVTEAWVGQGNWIHAVFGSGVAAAMSGATVAVDGGHLVSGL